MRVPESRSYVPVVLGFDPGFAKLGWVQVAIFPDREEVLAMGIVSTEKSSVKRKVLAADDNVRRGREVADAVKGLFSIGQYNQGTLVVPATQDADGKRIRKHRVLSAYPTVRAVCAESMSFPRNASAAAKMAITWGVLIDRLFETNMPLVQSTPQEIKDALCGVKSASKEEVRDAVVKRYGQGLHAMLKGYAGGDHNHAFDALAAVVAGLDSDVIRMARKMAA